MGAPDNGLTAGAQAEYDRRVERGEAYADQLGHAMTVLMSGGTVGKYCLADLIDGNIDCVEGLARILGASGDARKDRIAEYEKLAEREVLAFLDSPRGQQLIDDRVDAVMEES